MGWKDKMKEWGGGDFTFLTGDGECLIFRVVGEPVLLEGKFKGKPQQRIGCPAITDDGFVLFVMGKRLARKLTKFESLFGSAAFMAVRHGDEGDINTTYELKVLDDEGLTQKLYAVPVPSDLSTAIDEAALALMDIMQGQPAPKATKKK